MCLKAYGRGAKRDTEGRWVLGLDYPSSLPVLQGAVDPSARERMWRAFLRQGGEGNLGLLGEIGQLRREYAQLFGFASYADFTLRRRMAENTTKAKRFLEDVREAVTEREKRELEELRQAKAPISGSRCRGQARALGRELLHRACQARALQRRPERLSRLLPAAGEPGLRDAHRRESMGVKYTRVPGVKLWHPEAQAYVASDVKTGKPLAALYVDSYPRDGKYNHAAVWPIRSGSTRLKRAPQAALVVNFDRRA